MNIQGVSSYNIYSSMNLQGSSSTSTDFEQALMSSSEIMEKDDADGDGVLSIDETPLTEEMFSDADTDGDGYLTLEEIQAGEAARESETETQQSAFSENMISQNMAMQAYQQAMNALSLNYSDTSNSESYLNIFSGTIV